MNSGFAPVSSSSFSSCIISHFLISGWEKKMMMMRGGQSGMSTSSSRCQDCGNQAKRDCVYRRCRTCCKSKGFPCQTHIKSTWVPAYRRHQRHQQQQQQQQRQQQQQHQHLPHNVPVHQQRSLQPPNPKRHRDTSTFPGRISLFLESAIQRTVNELSITRPTNRLRVMNVYFLIVT